MSDSDSDWDATAPGGARKKPSGGKRGREDDEDEPLPAPKAARRGTGGGAAGAGASAAAATGGGAGGEDDDGDDELDPETEAKLAGMNELEREMYLFEREEGRQRQRQRKEVLNQARREAEAEQVEVRASSRRPRAATGADTAIGKLAAQREAREARDRKKQQAAEEREQQQQQQRRKRKQQEEEEAEEEPASEESAEAEEAGYSEEAEGDGDEGDDRAVHGARPEAYDDAASYEELEEPAGLEEVRSIQLKRSQLEAWLEEPFFEDDVKGCVLRIVANPGPEARKDSSGSPLYMMVKVLEVVSRNSYAFGTKPGARTRKWLKLDDMVGGPAFRHQMAQVSNSDVTADEFERARAKAAQRGARFITKGEVQAAQEQLHHARTFKYDSKLVKDLLDKKRAAGKAMGTAAQRRARLMHELALARQEGKPQEEVTRLEESLAKLEAEEGSKLDASVRAVLQAALAESDPVKVAKMLAEARVPRATALGVLNQRNKLRNVQTLYLSQNTAKAASTVKTGPDVFSRRHTQSKVYWATGRGAAAEDPGSAAGAGLRRQSSGAADTTQLQSSLKKLDPAELLQVLDLSLDMSRLPPRAELNQVLMPKRLLGPRWWQSLERRQAALADRSVLSLDDWQRKMAMQQQLDAGGGAQ